MINELEYHEGSIYANVWPSTEIVKINITSGYVTDSYELGELELIVWRDFPEANLDCLNGIAYNSKSKTFYLSGKQWPYIFEVELF